MEVLLLAFIQFLPPIYRLMPGFHLLLSTVKQELKHAETATKLRLVQKEEAPTLPKVPHLLSSG